MLEQILSNLINIGYAMLIFIGAYSANIAFSLWYNIEVLKHSFEKDKMTKGVIKAVIFIIGLSLLCITITTLPLYANKIGWVIPDEYRELFTNIVLIAVVLSVSIKYIKEAYDKFIKILNGNKSELQ